MCDSVLGVEEGRSDMTMVDRRVVLAVVVSQVATACPPVDVEHTLLCSILDPVKIHVNGFGSSLFHGTIGKAVGCGIVHLDGCGGLRVYYFY